MTQSAPLSGAVRPAAVTYVYPLPGDEILPRAELIIFDLDSKVRTELGLDPIELLYYGSPLLHRVGQLGGSIWWRADGSACHVLRTSRGNDRVVLHRIEARSGAAITILEETSDSPIDTPVTVRPGNVRTLDDAEQAVWFSYRDGWGHLYLYDMRSTVQVRQLTSGSWSVVEVHHVDEAARWVYFTGVGRIPGEDPYIRRLYRVSLDGGEPELLTAAGGSHTISFAPDGSRFTTTFSTIDSPPQLQLCGADGEVLATLETAKLDDLLATGWAYPERFTAAARDGETAVYGVMIRPSDFDPEQRYPVIDAVYAGPQKTQAPAAFAELHEKHPFWQAQAIAELGFIVVMIDGLGTPHRSKAFWDVSYRNLADAGVPDHIQALRELAIGRPYLDLDRVGIYGHSAGGYASCRAILAYPDFYKVCVASAGNHDPRLDKASWVERYMGWPVADHYRDQANRTIAHQLEGKLLLIHGELDENVPVASTLSLADALIQAEKDFDLLILPNRPHACGADPYLIRRRWDYFVRHLAGVAPPRFRIMPPDEM